MQCVTQKTATETAQLPQVPSPTPQVTYSVGVEQLYGAEHIKLPGHEELDSHIPREGGNIVLNCPLVNLFKKLLGGLLAKKVKKI